MSCLRLGDTGVVVGSDTVLSATDARLSQGNSPYPRLHRLLEDGDANSIYIYIYTEASGVEARPNETARKLVGSAALP
jgi:hypothetical protein